MKRRISRWLEVEEAGAIVVERLWECPECGNILDEVKHSTPISKNYNYCPGCGARLIEEREVNE